MQQYLLRRLLLFFPTLLVASLAIFVIMRILPGDVALSIAGSEDTEEVDIELLNALREQLGLTEPLPVQYGKWMWSMVNGEFGGASLTDREPLSEIVGRRLPVTFQLAAFAIVISGMIGIPLGVVAALRQNRWPDYLIRAATIAGHAVPNFWLALMLLLAMVTLFTWAPPLFYKDVWESPQTFFLKAIWPILLLAWGFSSNVTRVTRSNMLEVLRQDYVRTARSKGLAEQVVIVRHTLRNALIPVITISGLQLAALLSGTVILENIFGIPGLGQGIIDAATTRDYPVIQSLAVLLVFMVLGLNLIVDFVYVFIDPRISYS